MTNDPILGAWHNDPDLKAEVVARLRAHREADEFIQGDYQVPDPSAPSGYRGCAIGCTLPALPPLAYSRFTEREDFAGNWHLRVERLYGIPYPVGCAIDEIFESLPIEAAGPFAVEVIEAIAVGADLSGVEAGAAMNLADIDAGEAAKALIAELAAKGGTS